MKKVKRNFKGIWIPKAIWEADLLIHEKVFLAEIDSLDNDEGCFASNAYFSDFSKLTKARCSQIISKLEKKKLITVSLKYKDKQVIRRTLKVAKGVVNLLKGGSKSRYIGVVNPDIGGSKSRYSIEQSNITSSYNDIDKSISVRPAKRNGHSHSNVKGKEVDPTYLKLAKKLSKIVHTQKNIVHTPLQIRVWSNSFKQLDTINKVDISRQKAALKWYKKAVGGEYIPVVESGKSFREKFTKLEDAMNRKDFSNKPKLNNAYKDDFKLTKKSIKV